MPVHPEMAMPEATIGGVRRLAPPPRSLPLAVAAVVVVAAVALGFWVYGLDAVRALETSDGYRLAANLFMGAFAVVATSLLIPAFHSGALSFRARSLQAGGDIVAA